MFEPGMETQKLTEQISQAAEAGTNMQDGGPGALVPPTCAAGCAGGETGNKSLRADSKSDKYSESSQYIYRLLLVLYWHYRIH
jgi:hypothetical protein